MPGERNVKVDLKRIRLYIWIIYAGRVDNSFNYTLSIALAMG